MKKKILITGGLGFIGTNLAVKLIKKGYDVIALDNCSRKGNLNNLNYLKNIKSNNFYFINQDLTKKYNFEFEQILKKIDCIFHLAAQVAVTTSVVDPKFDYLNNIDATFKLLEAVRKNDNKKLKFIFASTNKVYGKADNLKIIKKKDRYSYKKGVAGVSEEQQLDFYSPYGCSKGAADSYVIDYGRIFNFDTVSLRQSCIYGNFQYGVEDQGWLAWMTIASLMKKKIVIYGDGKQVRDALHVDDLTDLYCKMINAKSRYFRQAYNVGGGSKNTISILEFLNFLKNLKGSDVLYKFSKERPGDQKIYISDINKLKKNFNWEPKIKLRHGLKKMHHWIESNFNDINSLLK
jgi:CDP-paratose 2-epimerase